MAIRAFNPQTLALHLPRVLPCCTKSSEYQIRNGGHALLLLPEILCLFSFNKGHQTDLIFCMNTKWILKWNRNGVVFSAKPEVKVNSHWLPLLTAYILFRGALVCTRTPNGSRSGEKPRNTSQYWQGTGFPDPKPYPVRENKGISQARFGTTRK